MTCCCVLVPIATPFLHRSHREGIAPDCALYQRANGGLTEALLCILTKSEVDDWSPAWSPDGIHIRFGLVLSMIVLCVTLNTDLLLGLVLRNWRASLIFAMSTGLVAVLTALGTMLILDRFGIRVGTVNGTMPKVAAIATMAAALAAGATLGVVFSCYVRAGDYCSCLSCYTR